MEVLRKCYSGVTVMLGGVGVRLHEIQPKGGPERSQIEPKPDLQNTLRFKNVPHLGLFQWSTGLAFSSAVF